MTYQLFIDDDRFPPASWDSTDHKIVRSSQEAIDCVKQFGFPNHISFDHDLAGDDKAMTFVHWIVNAYLDGELYIPIDFTFYVHSQNPIGAENIHCLMNQLITRILDDNQC